MVCKGQGTHVGRVQLYFILLKSLKSLSPACPLEDVVSVARKLGGSLLRFPSNIKGLRFNNGYGRMKLPP